MKMSVMTGSLYGMERDCAGKVLLENDTNLSDLPLSDNCLAEIERKMPRVIVYGVIKRLARSSGDPMKFSAYSSNM